MLFRSVAFGGLGDDIIDVRQLVGSVSAFWAPGDGMDTVRTTLGFDPGSLNLENYGSLINNANLRTLTTMNFASSLSEMKIVWTIASTKSYVLVYDVPYYIYSGSLSVVAKDGSGGVNLGTVVGTSLYYDARSGPDLYVQFDTMPVLSFIDGTAYGVEGWNIEIEIGAPASARTLATASGKSGEPFTVVSEAALVAFDFGGSESAQSFSSTLPFDLWASPPHFDVATVYQIA